MFLVPIVFLPIMVPAYQPHNRTIYVFVVMAVFWLAEVTPLQVTGLLPIAVMPFLGILDTDDVCKSFLTSSLAIFIGSTIVALAGEYSNLHTRLALGLLTTIGCSPKRVLFSFIITTGFLSMWMQNTIVVALMLPIVKAVLNEFEVGGLKIREENKPDQEEEDREASPIAIGYYLGVCYAASIGGCGTLIGSGTHLAGKGMYQILYPNATDHITFPRFMVYNLPWVLVALILLYPILLITNLGLFSPKGETGVALFNFGINSKDVAASVRQKFENIGTINLQEIQILILYLLMIFLLIFQSPDIMPGWADLIQEK
ncbi:protein I'm not dead yet-like [Rhagoletis pomonella]|uniref:protein I'm not dead yet-like n=1 Tax=Rhagoletis pomonella TaxID=28610 RepID=UPI001783DECB|nr:protein I'm not dead yet-like [Rhagoletis pomonella]